MKALILALMLSLGFAIQAHAQSVKLEKIPTKKAPATKGGTAAKSKTKTPPKRTTASANKTASATKAKTKGKKPQRATIKSSGGSTLGSKSKTTLPVKAANDAQKKKETQFKRRKKSPKSK